MRCHAALERIASVVEQVHPSLDPESAAHVGECPDCAEAWRRHQALLSILSSPSPSPEFADLAQAVLERLDGPSTRKFRWQWVAAAALALAALGLGYLFGQVSAGPSPASESMAATYQAAFTAQTASSPELAYLETGSRTAGDAPRRDVP